MFYILFLILLTSRLRDNIDELRRSLEPKENALEALQQSLLEKEQVWILELAVVQFDLPYNVTEITISQYDCYNKPLHALVNKRTLKIRAIEFLTSFFVFLNLNWSL